MLGGADNPNGELPSYITGADTVSLLKRPLCLYVPVSMAVQQVFAQATAHSGA
ncbi:InsB [Shigella sonnei]|nr:InsB [Shigella sonnei]